jgi:exonuclease SbcC
MRPERLELEGFTAFRRRTEVDFRGADLFALSGPTGAGKSSLIDAITFALYGSVARYDDARLVAPVISQGQAEARVALDFAVGDEHYRAVRVVRATANGATTKEARLERRAPDGDGDGELLAGDAKQVSAEVERLLGLGFKELTTCVVLPQGQFARFLHDTPSDRGDLLVRLLDLSLYGSMAQAAWERASTARARAMAAEQELERLAFATAEAHEAAAAHLAALEQLKERIEHAQPDLERYERSVAEAEEEASAAERRQAGLQGLAVPDGIEQAAARARLAGEEVTQLGRDLEAAEMVVERLERDLADQPDLATLKAAVERRVAHEQLGARITKGEVVVQEAAVALTKHEATREAAAEILQAATRVRDRARLDDRAADLRGHLHAGERCPVCDQVVDEVPQGQASQVSDAEEAVEVAQRGLAATDSDVQAAARSRQRYEDQLADLRAQLATVEESLDERPLDHLEQAIVARAAADAELGRSREAARAARKAREKAERRRTDVEQQVRSLRDEWVHQRARLLDVGATPPPDATGDLGEDWRGLVGWAEQQHPVLERQAATARQRADQQAKLRDDLRQQVLAACREAGVEVDDRPPRDACVDALAEARPALARIDEAIADRVVRQAERDREHERAEVAESLHRLLNARNFERWVLDEVLERLVEGATDVLHALSGGAYSLVRTEKGDFAVVDHTNADAVRSARTLSGGETFLASLALALALADRVADLSAVGAHRLEAIFLDEGFGTLDPDTLDVVASAIEELGAQGRTVGVVTHVRELAERLPVRFEVTKGPDGASVERVEA